jgi:hypothetical protein
MTEQPMDREGLNLFGQLITANIKQAQWTENQLHDSTQREAAKWKAAFMDVFDLLEEINETVDSQKIAKLLSYNYGRRDQAAQPFFWEDRK